MSTARNEATRMGRASMSDGSFQEPRRVRDSDAVDFSEFSLYLKDQQAVGAIDSVGAFTLAKERALEMLAEYSLSGDCDWALKVLQAITRCPHVSAVRINQSSREVAFELPDIDWQPAEVEAAFYNPDLPNEHPLRDLVLGLWDVGLRQKRPFQLFSQKTGEHLHWDGDQLVLELSPAPTKVSKLVVGQLSTVKTSLLHRPLIAQTGKRQIRLVQAIRNSTLVYPLNLSLNGQALGALSWRIRKELPEVHQLLQIHCVEAELPTFVLPKHHLGEPHTLMDRLLSQRNSELQRTAYQNFGRRSLPDRIPILGTFTANFALYSEAFHLSTYRLASAHSYLNWVQNGIVIDRDKLTLYPSPGSFDMFLSADGLPTDLTTLRLVTSQRKRERTLLAAAAMTERLRKAPKLNLRKFHEKPRRRGRLQGAGLALLSTASLGLGWGVEYLGYPLAAVIALRAGARKRQEAVSLETAYASAIDLFAPESLYSNASGSFASGVTRLID